MRFEGKNAALKRFAEAGVLGDVYYARASWFRQRQAPAWGGFLKKGLAGGGPLIDIGVHLLDLVLWMMGFPKPVAVCGVAPTKLANLAHVANNPRWGDWKRDGKDFDVEDFAVGLVRFEDGAVLVLEASFLMNIVEKELRKAIVCGTLGGMDIDEGKIMTQEHGIVRVSQVTGFAEPKALPAAITAFVEAVEKDGPVPVPAEETLCVMTILDGIYRSHAKGGAEVKLACAALEQEESGVQP